MASFERIDRISQEAQRNIDSIIRDDLNDPRIRGTWSIVRCEVTRDLRYCKVRISILEEDVRRDMMAALQKAAGFVRRELGHRMDLRGRSGRRRAERGGDLAAEAQHRFLGHGR